MEVKHLTPIKAIRAKCLECSGGKPSLIRKCDSEGCVLHFYRFGRNPARKGIGNHRVQETSTLASNCSISARVFEDGSQAKSKDMLSGNPGFKLDPNAKIALSGKGNFRIERAGKELVIKLTQE